MKSYFHQPGTISYVYETIPERVKKLADEDPDKTAFVIYLSKEERYEITRKELFDRSQKFARALLKAGLKKGDRVAFCVSNCIDWMSFDVGIMLAGGIAVHLLLGASDIKVALAGCSAIILDVKERWNDFMSIAQIHEGGKVTSETCPSMKLAIAVEAGSRPPNALLAPEIMAEIDTLEAGRFSNFPFVNPEDVAFIIQTSGTTGHPKKVQHTHFNAVNCSGINEDIYDSEDVMYNSRPMSYVGGYPFSYVSLGTKVVTGDAVFLNTPQNFDTCVDIWRKERCNVIGVAPHNLKNLHDFGFRVRIVISGGDLLTKDMINHTFVFADNVLVVYASTEAILISHRMFTKSDIDEHIQGMLGRPSPDVEVKIVNDKNEIVELGEMGTVCVRSPWVSKSYDDDRFNDSFQKGWFHTTDVCLMLPEGDLLMKGRTSDFILKGTVNLPIKLIESYVDQHPDVKQVVVVGIPDPSCGEDVCACVQICPNKKFDGDALRIFCENNMPCKNSFDWVTMMPSYFLQFDDFPTTESGKLDKRKIKELATKQVNMKQPMK